MVSTPLIRPFRKSVSAAPWSAYWIVSKVFAPPATAPASSHAHSRDAAVLIDDRDLEMFDVASHRVAQNHELHERKHHRDDDENRAAAKPAQLAFDDSPGAVHMVLPVSAAS
jgi:hypothetical protein